MKDWRSQSHVKWDCKYHVVIVPQYRRRKFYGSLRAEIRKFVRAFVLVTRVLREHGGAG